MKVKMRSDCYFLGGTRSLFPCLLLLFLGAFKSEGQTPLTSDEQTFFENQVRPLLANNCYKCHSIEQDKSKGGLTLDTKDGVTKGGDDGKVLIPGDPDHSMVMQAVEYKDADLQMPPKTRLTDQEVATLRQWIKMGAPDPRTAPNKLSGLTDKARSHWAYQPVKNPPVPTVKNAPWCKTPIDNFILAKLEEKGLTPSSPASRDALIRRAYYDLIGLPPSPDQIEAFEKDNRPDAFTRVVDELLASPHYGERWGRHWLDTARYSDTTGGNQGTQGKSDPYAWGYRDYVIASFNQDKPYNEFILEQLAADRLPQSKTDPSILAGLGFITVGAKFNNVNDQINERIDVVSKGLLAMTVSCARCHDHRFDPIPMTDYYALHGVFASCVDTTDKPITEKPQDQLFNAFESKLDSIQKQNRQSYKTLATSINKEFESRAALYLRYGLMPRRAKNDAEAQTINQEIDNANLNRGIITLLQQNFRYVQPNSPTLGPLRWLESVSDDDFPQKVPDLISAYLKPDPKQPPVNPILAEQLQSRSIQSKADLIDLYADIFHDIAPQAPEMITKVFASTGSTSSANTPTPTASTMEMNSMDSSMTGSDTASDGTVDPNILPFLSVPLPVQPDSELTQNKLDDLINNFQRDQLEPTISTLQLRFVNQDAIQRMELTDPGAPARAMPIVDADKPHDSALLIRGQDQVPGPVVQRHFLTILSPNGQPTPYHDGSGRLELAQDIANPKNPLTARVMVNRVWMYHFGMGIVPTPDDLGNQSEPPSHPELLDYLSTYFVDQGWSLKKLHRLIMLSSVYQESTQSTPNDVTVDPENRLLSHANIRRLDFESMRDSLLAFSGKLDSTIGGKPINLTDEPYSYRRSIYGYIDRQHLPELMSYFDFSDPNMTNSRRNSTIVPQQALYLMNDPMIVGIVRDILNRNEVKVTSTPEEKVSALYRIIFQRSPTDEERQTTLEFLDAMDAHGKKALEQSQAPVIVATKGDPIRNPGKPVDRTPLNSWELLTQALLFTNEASYVN